MAADKSKDAKKEGEGEGEEKKGGSKKLIIFGVVGLLVIGGGVFAATTVLGGQEEEEEVAAEAAPPEEGEILALESLVVNLADTDRDRYVRVGLAAVLAKETLADDIKARLPLLRNAMLRVFVPKKSQELTKLDGLEQLHEELSEAAKGVYPNGNVLRVVVTDIVVQ